MHPDDWKKVKDVLIEAIELAPAERSRFIDASGLSDELAAEVRALVELETDAEKMMNLSAVEYSRDFIDGGSDLPEGSIGVYRIKHEIGRGGMGTVYLAERDDGKFDQLVALKLLKSEMNTPAVRRHFEQEREILAALKHPNIASLLDAGTTENNVPFIAIEYIDGLPIDEYCNANGLDIPERLALFRKVCDAVDHAHRNLIVHRDLKPSNVLVTADGTPKLLDFGISKILSKDVELQNSATITRMGVMTPSYASPEQLQKQAVTTASDIYSLGVILYEILCGHRPFETAENDIREIYKAVLETLPEPPSSVIYDTEKRAKSAALSSRADTEWSEADTSRTLRNNSKRTEPRDLIASAGRLRGDLDNIVLKALRKEPERRYSSAEKFSEDIGRHLDNVPVEARPNTFAYRAEKFIKRNRLAVVSGAFVLLAVSGGTATAFWQSTVAERERIKAEKRFSDVRTLANSYLFEVYPEVEKLEGSLKVRETIVAAALKYLDSLSQESSGDLGLQRELAAAYEKVGDVEGAINTQSNADIIAGLQSYRKAERLRREVFAAMRDDAAVKEELAQNQYIIAKTLWWANDSAGAEEKFEEALKLRRELHAGQPDDATLQDRLAVLLIDYAAVPAFNSQSEKARPLFEEAETLILDLMRRDPANDQFKRTYSRLLRAFSQEKSNTGDYAGAVADLERSIEITKELIAATPDEYRLRRTMWINDFRLCEVYIIQRNIEKVVPACEAAIAFNVEAQKKEPNDAASANDLAVSYFNAARANRIANSPVKAIEYAKLATGVMTELSRISPGMNDYIRAIAIYDIEVAENSLTLGKTADARAHLQKARTALEKVTAADSDTATFQYDLSKVYRLLAIVNNSAGGKKDAVQFADRAIAIIKKLDSIKALKASDSGLIAELESERANYSK